MRLKYPLFRAQDRVFWVSTSTCAETFVFKYILLGHFGPFLERWLVPLGARHLWEERLPTLEALQSPSLLTLCA